MLCLRLIVGAIRRQLSIAKDHHHRRLRYKGERIRDNLFPNLNFYVGNICRSRVSVVLDPTNGVGGVLIVPAHRECSRGVLT